MRWICKTISVSGSELRSIFAALMLATFLIGFLAWAPNAAAQTDDELYIMPAWLMYLIAKE